MQKEDTTYYLADGTFQVCPTTHYQFFTVHAVVGWSETKKVRKPVVSPLIYALLPDKEQATYERFFNQLKQKMPGMQPLKLNVDFELGISNAMEKVWPLCQIQNCLFHFGQCGNRKVNSMGAEAKKKYKTEGHPFRNLVLSITGLAFIPPNLIPEAFKKICLEYGDDTDPHSVEFSRYFLENYIGFENPIDGRRKVPRFLPERWNVFNRTLKFEPRTNNNVEGFNSGLRHLFNVNGKPTVAFFWKKLHELDRRARSHLEEFRDLGKPHLYRRSQRHLNAEKSIHAMVCRFNSTTDTVQYCRKIGSILKVD